VLLGTGVDVRVAAGVFVFVLGVLVLARPAERVTPRVRFSATLVATAGVLTTTACVWLAPSARSELPNGRKLAAISRLSSAPARTRTSRICQMPPNPYDLL
jgi:hypothetical protein